MKKTFPKFDAVGFFSNILAVILSIVITFSIQGVIDRRDQKENISSALRLVETELTGCKNLHSCLLPGTTKRLYSRASATSTLR